MIVCISYDVHTDKLGYHILKYDKQHVHLHTNRLEKQIDFCSI